MYVKPSDDAKTIATASQCEVKLWMFVITDIADQSICEQSTRLSNLSTLSNAEQPI